MNDNFFSELSNNLPNDYKLLDIIDLTGGQGGVYKGLYQGIEVAIKLFKSSTDERRLIREIDLLQAIESPNIVKIISYFKVKILEQDCFAIVYEFLNGNNILSYLANEAPPINCKELLILGHQISWATELLWNRPRRIVHRDIKPGNIIKAENQRFVLVDFGIARNIDKTAITARGLSPGTQGYKSPEQNNGRRNLTIKSDTFSLGITLYEIASKIHPFKANQDLIGIIRPESLGVYRSDLPASLIQIIDKMVSILPYERPSFVSQKLQNLLERG